MCGYSRLVGTPGRTTGARVCLHAVSFCPPGRARRRARTGASAIPHERGGCGRHRPRRSASSVRHRFGPRRRGGAMLRASWAPGADPSGVPHVFGHQPGLVDASSAQDRGCGQTIAGAAEPGGGGIVGPRPGGIATRKRRGRWRRRRERAASWRSVIRRRKGRRQAMPTKPRDKGMAARWRQEAGGRREGGSQEAAIAGAAAGAAQAIVAAAKKRRQALSRLLHWLEKNGASPRGGSWSMWRGGLSAEAAAAGAEGVFFARLAVAPGAGRSGRRSPRPGWRADEAGAAHGRARA